MARRKVSHKRSRTSATRASAPARGDRADRAFGAASGAPKPPRAPSKRRSRVALVLAGIVLGQAFLFGPSLAGLTIRLPLAYLATPRIYLPDTAETRAIVPTNPNLSDEVLSFEPDRIFATAEVRGGRLPLWNPNSFAGAPFTTWAVYSPFNVLSYLFPSPVTLAWIQLLKALVAGLGAYVFFRRILGVGFWPATPFRLMGFVSVIIASGLFAFGPAAKGCARDLPS